MWVNMAFSILFGLLAEGRIPRDKYKAFRKLAFKILRMLPDTEFDDDAFNETRTP